MLIKSRKIEYVKDQKQGQGEFIPSDYAAAEQKSEQKKAKSSPVVQTSISNPKDEEQKKIRAAAEEAYDRGLAEGTVRGRDAERKKLHSAVTAFEKGLTELARIRSSIFENLEPEILSLAIDIAEKIIHREVQTNHEVFLSILKESVRNILDREGMKIRLHPKDYEYMLEFNPGILNSFEGVKNPIFERDNTMKRGDVVVETLFGEVDARLESQLEEIKTALTPKG